MYQESGLRQALARAQELGFRVSEVRRTGEIRVSHPLFPGSFRINARRKDAPRVLITRIRKVEKERGKS